MELAPKASARTAGSRLLKTRDLCERFEGMQALKGASPSADSGEIVASLDENGAGKSTLINLLTGVHNLGTGSILSSGRDLSHSPQQMPVAFNHQNFGLIEWMTASENIWPRSSSRSAMRDMRNGGAS